MHRGLNFANSANPVVDGWRGSGPAWASRRARSGTRPKLSGGELGGSRMHCSEVDETATDSANLWSFAGSAGCNETALRRDVRVSSRLKEDQGVRSRKLR